MLSPVAIGVSFGLGIGLRNVRFELTVGGSDDTPPTAKGSASVQVAKRFEPINFDASASRDNGGPVAFNTWKFGRDGSSAGPQVTHRFSKAGRETITLKVWDTNGASASQDIPIDIQLEGVAIPSGQTMIAAFGGDGQKRYGFPKIEAKNGKTLLPLDPEKPLLRMRMGDLLGAVYAAGEGKRIFGELSASHTGNATQPLQSFNAVARIPNSVVLAIDQKFHDRAASNGADISKGSIYAGGIRGAKVHWVIRTPKGWRIRRSGFATGDGVGRGAKNHEQRFSEIWLEYYPENPGDLQPSGKPSTNRVRCHAVGMAPLIGNIHLVDDSRHRLCFVNQHLNC